MRSGWFQDNYRHSLAARGIKTRYYYSKNPYSTRVVLPVYERQYSARAALSEEKAKQELRKFKEHSLEENTSAAKTIRLIQEGRYDQIDAKKVKKFTPEQAEAVRSAARLKAIQLAQVGIETPSGIKILLDDATTRRIKDIKDNVRYTEEPRSVGSVYRRGLVKRLIKKW